MSKKQIVKQIIDRLIREGEDFTDLTQGYLSELEELEGVSKTTIKRAKNEYKQENASVKNNFKEKRIKKRIYKFLDRHPKATLSDLREEFPSIIPAKVSEYHLFWKRKQEKKKQNDQQSNGTITPRKLKEMVFKYLDENPYATSDQLITVFSSANRSSVSSYFNNWKKKQLVDKESVKKGSLVQVLFDYLDKQPEAGIKDLQAAFTDVPKKSLEIYFSLWKKKHSEREVTIVETVVQEVQQLVEKVNGSASSDQAYTVSKSAKSDRLPFKSATGDSESEIQQFADQLINTIEKSPQVKKPRQQRPRIKRLKQALRNQGTVSSADTATPKNNSSATHDLILSLENTIEAQKIIIEVLNFEQNELKHKKMMIFPDSVEMNEHEISEIRSFISNFLAGLKMQKVETTL